MTPERLAEIRELHTDATEGFECCGRHVIEAFSELLAEVDRLHAQLAAVRQLVAVCQQENVPLPPTLVLDRLGDD